MAGFSERYRSGETSHTIHVWWARRPHAAMRALVFASVAKDCSLRANKTLSELGRIGISDNASDLGKILQFGYNYPPKVLDMFGGGGTIPFESASLGLEAHALDANNLSVFIQKSLLQFSQGIDSHDRIQLVEETGRKVLNKAQQKTNHLFLARGQNIIAYLWTYRLTCQNCNHQFLLFKRPWISKKKGRSLALTRYHNDGQENVKITLADQNFTDQTNWIGRDGAVSCPKCKTTHSEIDIRLCQDALLVTVKKTRPTGKEFCLAGPDHELDHSAIALLEDQLLHELNVDLPVTQPPRWSGIINPPLYGMVTHADYFNPRQRVVLLTLLKELQTAYEDLKTSHGRDVSLFVISALSGLIDQLVDWNCRLSTWISQNEQVGRGFCGPGVAMYWDYCETDPFLKGPANLWDKLERIVAGVSSIPTFPIKPTIRQGYAQNLPYPDQTFDAIICDPPYYDNIFYSALADFIYVWKRMLFVKICPDLFDQSQTETKHELVASTFRAGSPPEAHQTYCEQFGAAIAEAARVLKPDGIFSLVYSHGSIAGWEAIVRSYRKSPFLISSIQPLCIERKQRPRAVFSEAINTCVVFVARKTSEPKYDRNSLSLLDEFNSISNSKFAANLETSGWCERDIGIAVFAQGVALLANYGTTDLDDRQMLRKFAEIVSRQYSDFSLTDRKSL